MTFPKLYLKNPKPIKPNSVGAKSIFI